ncbi:hypothetical protein B296_00012710 [Ensete ventricosum]|uniref:AP2/ERF and B3 domain-containing protein n=1 Tax=Ensete ventricosum TaxID=4639 RepID=A0A427B6Z2_ENSVE|nr:hypothetical protein B296_00012710 [Ensete ventricosum]
MTTKGRLLRKRGSQHNPRKETQERATGGIPSVWESHELYDRERNRVQTQDIEKTGENVDVKVSLQKEDLFTRRDMETSSTGDAWGESSNRDESRKLPSSRYKGVVPQPNGRWGAQIYEKHERVWLGTFNAEAEAARAYDVAVRRFRGRDGVTNFKPLNEADDDDAAEISFIGSRSKVEIVDMLRRHSYHHELQQSRRSFGADKMKTAPSPGAAMAGATESPVGAQRQHLFDKAVTPSDVGKLNRLVVPKQHAEKHLPLQDAGGGASNGMLLKFEDGCGRVWRFRYSYWNSSQSYVMTKGWSRFVKEKGLEAGDVVSFQRSTGPEKQLFIDSKVRAGREHTAAPMPRPPVEHFRLFGVNIVRNPATHRDDTELTSSQDMFKRQRTEAL